MRAGWGRRQAHAQVVSGMVRRQLQESEVWQSDECIEAQQQVLVLPDPECQGYVNGALADVFDGGDDDDCEVRFLPSMRLRDAIGYMQRDARGC